MIKLVRKLIDLKGRETNMLALPKKNQYALRAIFELAKHMNEGPIKISQIAAAQAIPVRFLEVILNQLKGSGLVESKRGFYGGYYLLKDPDKISVGDLLRFLQGKPDDTSCIACVSSTSCPFGGKCAFSAMWIKVKEAAFKIYDETTIKDLIAGEHGANEKDTT